MNTERVKSILIGIFLIMAIALAGLIFVSEQRYVLSAPQEAAIRTVMERSGVVFTDNAVMTRSHRPMRQLALRPYEHDFAAISARFFGDEIYTLIETEWDIIRDAPNRRLSFLTERNTILFEIHEGLQTPEFQAAGFNKSSAEALAENFAAQMLDRNINMTLHSVVLGRTGDYIFNYFGSYGNYHIFNNHLRVRVTAAGLTRMEFSYFHIEGFMGEAARIYSADEAIVALMNFLRSYGVLGGNTRHQIEIINMRLLYHLEDVRSDSPHAQMASPSYAFTVIIDQTRFNYVFNANTNSFARGEVFR